MSKYPTGVECHGGTLRVWFMYQGRRYRESLGVPDTPKNRKMAGELRTSICYAIKTGTFNYASQFPQSPILRSLGYAPSGVTLGNMADKWLELKRHEIAKSTFKCYEVWVKGCVGAIGSDRLLSDIKNEDILSARSSLLTGNQSYSHGNAKSGRSVRTVNAYISCLSAILQFAFDNGYIDKLPSSGITPLRKSKRDPDPLSKDEYRRAMSACTTSPIRNLWCFAINSGLRHGEIAALAWEDIDTQNWTATVSRNISLKGHFTLPKTDAGIRVVNLTDAAIDALKSQMAYTRMGKKHAIVVALREYGESRTDDCTFVFSPQVTSHNGIGGNWYSPGSIGGTWSNILKRAGIRHRRAYETRNTYACWALSAGVNPSFIASQMGHTSAQMVFNVYGKWMKDNNDTQMSILNRDFSNNVPYMPQEILLQK